MGALLMISKSPGKSSALDILAYIHCGCVPRIPALLEPLPSQVLSLVVHCTLFSYSFKRGGFTGSLIGKTIHWD